MFIYEDVPADAVQAKVDPSVGMALSFFCLSNNHYICELRNQINNYTRMEVKDLYEAPVTTTLELSNEGIICLSPRNPFEGLEEYEV